jgi:hypothetical protein
MSVLETVVRGGIHIVLEDIMAMFDQAGNIQDLQDFNMEDGGAQQLPQGDLEFAARIQHLKLSQTGADRQRLNRF